MEMKKVPDLRSALKNLTSFENLSGPGNLSRGEEETGPSFLKKEHSPGRAAPEQLCLQGLKVVIIKRFSRVWAQGIQQQPPGATGGLLCCGFFFLWIRPWACGICQSLQSIRSMLASLSIIMCLLFLAGLVVLVRVVDACGLTLDPNTVWRCLSLSEDHREVTWVEEDQSYPDHPERFESWSQVLCGEGLTGRCYWEVEGRGGVDIGVTYRGITRRGVGDDCGLGRNNKSWCLYCYDGYYIAWYNDSRTVIPLPPPVSTRVGVYLDRPAGSLSFYRVSPGVGGSSHTLTHIHTFHTTFTQEDLLPAFGVYSGPGSSVSLCGLYDHHLTSKHREQKLLCVRTTNTSCTQMMIAALLKCCRTFGALEWVHPEIGARALESVAVPAASGELSLALENPGIRIGSKGWVGRAGVRSGAWPRLGEQLPSPPIVLPCPEAFGKLRQCKGAQRSSAGAHVGPPGRQGPRGIASDAPPIAPPLGLAHPQPPAHLTEHLGLKVTPLVAVELSRANISSASLSAAVAMLRSGTAYASVQESMGTRK
ncbi:Stonustoxin subunit beta [Merluccius polli]|uniref:Stonustoxin subunit beta n=1 Tax=Merluccius polli TaxID=89951 RepID=A0AA47MXE6_MERPO|nr:Stonustoxin subunit beta [Merluccius polli]